MRLAPFAGLCLVAGVLGAPPPATRSPAPSCPEPPAPSQTVSSVRADVDYLADPRLEGRGTGTAGERCAREYIAGRLRGLGLLPVGDDDTFFQRVPVWGDPSVPPANVVALLPGEESGATGEAILVGAHHDHLGRDSAGVVRPGADDNASGVAALLRVAKRLAAEPPPGPVVFATFTSEESLMFGSKRYVESPAVPLERTRAMLNLDMVGRLSEQPLRIAGLSTDPLWPALLEAARADGLEWRLEGEVPKGSDHLAFHRAGVPVLYLRTGRHADYHRPTDVAEKVDAEGIETVARLVERLVRARAREARPR